ncbi:hypothetical protein U1Q18_012377 [Sarracenia purpurea var. burkii]
MHWRHTPVFCIFCKCFIRGNVDNAGYLPRICCCSCYYFGSVLFTEATELGKKTRELKKTADALHQEERSGSKGTKWRKNVKTVEKVLTFVSIVSLRDITGEATIETHQEEQLSI